MRIAIAGGTGTLGRYVVDAVRAKGHQPIVISRSRGIDVVTRTGLDDALDGTSVVIDATNVTTVSEKKSTAFFETVTRNLIDAGQRAGVTHHLVLSIVGIDRVNLGYYRGKLAQERVALAGPVPATVLRATQFYEFAAQMLARGGPFAIVPRMITQPIAAREVADALVVLALGEPVGRASDIAGPEQRQMSDMVRAVVRARGEHRFLVPIRLPGAVGRAMANGGLLPTSDGPRGTQTFEEWLATDRPRDATSSTDGR
jgi:uncharacterized protein YbjT (DUF2867 family)